MKKEERRLLQEQKLKQMMEYENDLYEKGFRFIAGIDEVGRGPLAGPVVAAAVILPPDWDIPGIDDSKKLSEKKREEYYELIRDYAVAWAIGIADHKTIDRINILEATKVAMEEAVRKLETVRRPDHLLLDAVRLSKIEIPQISLIKGDERSVSIAAASIMAKVTRDRMMVDYHRTYPHYGFDRNKGYGTKSHYEGITGFGPCEIHRLTFL